MGPVGRARQAGVREHQGAGRASSTPALTRPPRNPEWAKLQSATWAPQLQPERWSCPDLCDLESSSALVSPSTPFRWGAFERPRKKSFICMLFSATFYRPACQLFWVLALYPLSSRPLLCPPWASPGGAGPLDMPPPGLPLASRMSHTSRFCSCCSRPLCPQGPNAASSGMTSPVGHCCGSLPSGHSAGPKKHSLTVRCRKTTER